MIVIESLLFFFNILPKSALRRHLRTRQKICVSPQILFEDIANFILDTLGIMKITMEFWYGGGCTWTYAGSHTNCIPQILGIECLLQGVLISWSTVTNQRELFIQHWPFVHLLVYLFVTDYLWDHLMKQSTIQYVAASQQIKIRIKARFASWALFGLFQSSHLK